MVNNKKHLNSLPSYLMREQLNANAFEDYDKLIQLLHKHNLGSHQQAVPLQKYVVSVLGCTSSGKSSFINHVLNGLSVRQTGPEQIDTVFTIVECVSEDEFCRVVNHSNNNGIVTDVEKIGDNKLNTQNSMKIHHHHLNGVYDPNKKFTAEELRSPLHQVPLLDHRMNQVFMYLDGAATLSRYSQFDSFKPHLLQQNLVRSVLVNEKFVSQLSKESNHLDSNLINTSTSISSNYTNDLKTSSAMIDYTRVIYIDSPGFDALTLYSMNNTSLSSMKLQRDGMLGSTRTKNVNNQNILDEFLSRLELLHFIYQLSDLVLFFVPANNISLISNPIVALELTMLSAELGFDAISQFLKSSLSNSNPFTSSFTPDMIRSLVSGIIEQQSQKSNVTASESGQGDKLNVEKEMKDGDKFRNSSSKSVPQMNGDPIHDGGNDKSTKTASIVQTVGRTMLQNPQMIQLPFNLMNWLKSPNYQSMIYHKDSDLTRKKNTSVWDKVFIVLSRIDTYYREKRATDAAAYELRGVLDASLSILQAPVFHRVLYVGLPEPQKKYSGSSSEIHCGNLYDLKGLISQLGTNEQLHMKRLEIAIQNMCAILQKHLQSTFRYRWFGKHKDLSHVMKIMEQSEFRLHFRHNSTMTTSNHPHSKL